MNFNLAARMQRIHLWYFLFHVISMWYLATKEVSFKQIANQNFWLLKIIIIKSNCKFHKILLTVELIYKVNTTWKHIIVQYKWP